MRKVSVVIPMFNEALNLNPLRERLEVVLAGLDSLTYEIVLVDDHSTDQTRVLAQRWTRENPRVRYIRFSRNFGSHAAIAAGLKAATGNCAVFLAADLQDPPEMIPELLEQWEQGNRVVWAVRHSSAGVGWAAKLASNTFWRIMRTICPQSTPPVAADCALLDRQVLDAYSQMNTRNDSLIATICWLGFKQTTVTYSKAVRNKGSSGWTFAKRIKLAIDTTVGFSYWPIRAMSLLGIGCALVGFAFMLYVVWEKICGRIVVQGWAGIISVMLTGMGILMVMIGVLGEYLWRVLDEARRRPKYIIEEQMKGQPEVIRVAQRNRSEVEAVNDSFATVRPVQPSHGQEGGVLGGMEGDLNPGPTWPILDVVEQTK